ncbi:uncharacterized protein [Asterias amurensis]|uniref:uncharacterized protein n=1 Tax=Asterias amurensis TaxID=7602 RepID=UPI003AB3BB92
MKSCGVIFLIAVVYLRQLKKIQADMQDPVGNVPITIPVGPDQEGPACRTCCPAAVPAVHGNPGHMGPSGFPGLPGEKGDPGLDGLKGTTGARGGLPGKIGEPGLRGNPGIGPKGVAGQMGLAGLVGPKGFRGDYGPRGYSREGYPGVDGLNGGKGMPGEPGLTGPKGDRGDGNENPGVVFTLRRKSSIFSTSDNTRLPFEEVTVASPDAEMIDLDMGVFTCPLSGTYVFMFSVLKSYEDNNNLRVHLHKNEEDIVSAKTTAPPAKNYHPIGGSTTLDLEQGDTVFLTFYGSVRNVHYVTDTNEFTTFSGFLLP